MAIEILSSTEDKKFKIICPACRQVLIVNAAAYEVDATKPILSNCAYCGAGIFSCMLLFASRDLKQLQTMISQAVNAVGANVSRQQTIIDGKPLGDKPSQ